MRRREFFGLLGGAAISSQTSLARAADPVRRVGVLFGIQEATGSSSLSAIFTTELQLLGWVEGGNVQIDTRYAGGDVQRANAIGKELAASKPDVLVAQSPISLAALRSETKTIPIVFALVSDPIGAGFVGNFARPGGNITGFTSFEPSAASKWLELLKEIAPQVERVAFICNPDTEPAYATYLRHVEAAASSFAMNLTPFPVHDIGEIERAISLQAHKPGGGLVVPPDVFTIVNSGKIVEFATRERLPAVYWLTFAATLGGLIGYGINPSDVMRRSASYVDRILRGAVPGELPIQAPTKFEMAINLTTARALGLAIPQSLLIRADEVIE
jgi:putative tryptophan/tyrosine transport system substrate-binding protein